MTAMHQEQRATRGNRGTTDRRCRNCGSFVTPDFARVFGNNDDEVFGCLECMTATDVKSGEARAESVEGSTPGGGRGTIR